MKPTQEEMMRKVNIYSKVYNFYSKHTYPLFFINDEYMGLMSIYCKCNIKNLEGTSKEINEKYYLYQHSS